MQLSEVKFDCRNFRTGIPCKPNKEFGAICSNCDHYDPVKKRLLIIKLGALGDVIRTTPLLQKFKSEYEGLHVTWLTLSPAILPQNSIDQIYSWNETSLYILRNLDFDIAINLDKEFEACMLLNEVKADVKYGFTWENGHIAPATPEAMHKLITGFFDQNSQANTKSYLEEIFEICSFEFAGEEYEINLNHSLADKWRAYFSECAEGRPVVGLNTGCGPRWKTRLWSEKQWEELAEKLYANGYYPVFLGGKLEDDKNTRMSGNTGQHYPGHFSLEEFISLTDACDVIVTQVSMMMHIATALRKKLVLCNTIFNKYEFELYGRGVLIEPETGCDCYFGNSCSRDHACMLDITPEQLFDAVEKLAGS